jgi:hypothetical protein
MAMPDRKDSKRSAPISYRPPAALRGELYARQLKSGLSMNAFITKSIFDAPVPRQSRRPSMEAGELARLLGHAARIRERLDEIAETGDDSAGAQHIATAQEDIATLRAAILKAMGRAP